MPINVSDKYYIDGHYFNIPIAATNSVALSNAVQIIADSIKNLPIEKTVSINEIEFNIDDSFKEFNALGDIGYSHDVQYTTTSFYVLFTIEVDGVNADWTIPNDITAEVLSSLSKYLKDNPKSHYEKSKLSSEILDDGSVSICLKAYFKASS